MRTLEEARKTIADLAIREGEHQFAREVTAGYWDHRNDVQAALKEGFVPRKIKEHNDD